MSVEEADSVAEALCASVVRCFGSTTILAGFGSRLKAFQCPSGAVRLDIGVLHGSRIHGIVVFEDEHDVALIAIHGARQLVIAALSCTSSLPAAHDNKQPLARSLLELQVIYHVQNLADWVLDAKFVSISYLKQDASFSSGQTNYCCDVALGMMNNYVELWRIGGHHGAPFPGSSAAPASSASLLGTAASTERLLLYAMRLAVPTQLPKSESSIPSRNVVVASGTIFHMVLVWIAQLTPATSNTAAVSKCAPLYKLCGHCGSVLRLQWACDLQVLLSAADDRTARVWRLPERWWLRSESTGTDEACGQSDSMLVHTLWGHTARVWDATLIGSCASYPMVVVTAAEDGAVRVWNAQSGNCEALIRCHSGHGAWCCVGVGPHLLVTGGGDCSLKLWNLQECLPAHTTHDLTQALPLSALQLCDAEHSKVKKEQGGIAPCAREGAPSATSHLILSLPTPAPSDTAPFVSLHGEDQCVHTTAPAALPVPHDSTSEGVCALALSTSDTVYVATSLGRIMRLDLAQATQHNDAEGNLDNSGAWSSVCVAPQQHMPLSCCSARRYSNTMPCFLPESRPNPSHLDNNCCINIPHSVQGSIHAASAAQEGGYPGEKGSVDVVVCGSRSPGLTIACVANNTASHSQPAVLQATHMPLSGFTQAPILAVWMPECLPPGHVLCADSDNNVWWLFVRVGAYGSSQSPLAERLESEGGSTIPTADLGGTDLPLPVPPCPSSTSAAVEKAKGDRMVVLATCCCGSKLRVASVEVLLHAGLVVVGDSLGGVAVYSFPPMLCTAVTMADAQSALVAMTEEQCSSYGDVGEKQGSETIEVVPLQLPCVTAMRKVHASTPVTLARAWGDTLFTGGRNGTLAKWNVVQEGSTKQRLNTVANVVRIACGREVRVAAMTGIVDMHCCDGTSSHSELIVAGFKANQFMLWDVEAEVELLSTSSGGWRRPFAVWLGGSGCFTVVLLKERHLKIISKTTPAHPTALQCPAPSPAQVALACMNSGQERDSLGSKTDSGDAAERNAVKGQLRGAEEAMHARALVLMPPHHGKIVHACVCLQVSAQLVAVATASEDGSVRVVSLRCDKTGAMIPGAAARLLLGKHAAGGAIRCLAASPVNPKPTDPAHAAKRWLLVSAGAKEVQAAWGLSFNTHTSTSQLPTTPTEALRNEPTADDKSFPSPTNSGAKNITGTQKPSENRSHDVSNSASLQGRWMATLPPPKVGLTPKRNVGFHAALGERRTMALCTFAVRSSSSYDTSERCFVVQSASAGALHMQRFCQSSLQWLQVAQLRHYGSVVLSIAAAPLTGALSGAVVGNLDAISQFDILEIDPSHVNCSTSHQQDTHHCYDAGQRMLVCTGGTEGNVSLFDVTTAICSDITRNPAAAADEKPATANSVDSSNTLICIEPLMTLQSVHQTGVNAIVFTQVGDLLWVVSGGDDQGLTVTMLGPKGIHSNVSKKVDCSAGSVSTSDAVTSSVRRGGQGNYSRSQVADQEVIGEPRESGKVLPCVGGGGMSTLCVMETVKVDCAHVSAVKGLCSRVVTGGDDCRCMLQVCSIGWDEFLRVWQIERCCSADCTAVMHKQGGCGVDVSDALHLRRCSGKTVVVQEIANQGVDVCEPCCVAGCDSGTGGGVWNVVVGGRGTQLFSLYV